MMIRTLLKHKTFQLILSPALYLVILFFLFGWILTKTDALIYGDDIGRSYYFFTQYLSGSVHSGFIPWWNPFMFSGVPFIANPITNAFYPVNWLFFVLPGRTVYPIIVIFHLLLAMTGMYFLLRTIVPEKDRVSAWVGGLAFGLSGFFMARIYAGHIDMIASASYLPLVFFLFHRAMSKRSVRGSIIAGFVLFFQILAGYHTMSFLTCVAVGILALVYMIKERSIKPIFAVLIGVAVAVGLSAFILLPIQEFVRGSIRTFEKPYSWSSYGATKFYEFGQVLSPFFLGDQRTYTGSPPNYWEHAMFFGRVCAILAVYGFIMAILTKKFRGMPGAAFLIALFGAWVALGGNAPFDLQKLLWQTVPVYTYLRIPSRHLLLFIFGAVILGAYGLSRVRNRLLQFGLAAGIIIELIFFGRYFIEVSLIPETRHDPALIAKVQEGNGLSRILPNFGCWLPQRDALDFDAGMTYGIYSATGYDSTLLRNYYEFIDAANGAATPSILSQDVQIPYLNIYSPYVNFLNVKYVMHIVSNDFLYPGNGQYALVRNAEERGYRLYENKDVLPRFFLVPTVTVRDTREEIMADIRGGVDLTKTVLVERKNNPLIQSQDNCNTVSASSPVKVVHIPRIQ